jgi:serine/threonine protein kinase
MDATGESTMNKPPDRLVDRYSFQRFLGTRDPFRVWLAHDERLMRDVAIKQFLCKVRPGDVRGQRMRKMAVREAQAASQISHHNVLRVYDLVESDDLIWLVMEFLPSRSLRELVCEHTRLGPAYVASVGVAVLDALTAAHREGVLHRDVTPDNVLIGENGRVALTDFGLAAWNPYDGRTLFGADPHAPHYVAPERARFGLSIPEGDLWSLGATLYAAVEGHCPYARATVTETLVAMMASPPDAPIFAGPLTTVLCGLLQRDPRMRMTAPEARRHLLKACVRLADDDGTMPLRPARQRLQSAMTVMLDGNPPSQLAA